MRQDEQKVSKNVQTIKNLYFPRAITFCVQNLDKAAYAGELQTIFSFIETEIFVLGE